MIDMNIIAQDFLTLRDNDKAVEFLERRIASTFESINASLCELYSPSEYLASFLIFMFFNNIESLLEFHEISDIAIGFNNEDYDEEGDL